MKRAGPFVAALAGAMIVCIGMLMYGTASSHSGRYSYLVWNLFLAALPLIFALRLRHVLRSKRWSDWPSIGWTLLWLLFLPNSFYLISDFIHLREVSAQNILFTVVLFTSFIYLGVFLGFCSLYVVHEQLRRRLSRLRSLTIIAIILLVCSIGIYIGRDLRWNSWDVLVSPFGLLFDVSDRLLRPDAYPEMFVTVFSFFALLSSLYGVAYTAARGLRKS